MVDLDLASSEMARLAKVDQGWHPAPPERAQDARSRPRPGVGPSDLEKRLYGPYAAPESADQVRGGRPGRAGA